MRTHLAILATGLVIAACASAPQSYSRLPAASADECAVISAYVRDLPSHQEAERANGMAVFFHNIAEGRMQLGVSLGRISADTVADTRGKFGHPARLDGCAELSGQAAAAGWQFGPRFPRNMGDRGSYRTVDRVGFNGDHTEAVLSATVGGSYGSGRFAWFDIETLLFRKDPKTGRWSQAAVLEGLTT